MTDWIKVLLGQPLEEEREEGLEELNRAAMQTETAARAARRRETGAAGAKQPEQTELENAGEYPGLRSEQTEEAAEEKNAFPSEWEAVSADAAGMPANPLRQRALEVPEPSELSAVRWTGEQSQGELLAWRQSGAETLNAVTAEQQAEWAAAWTGRRETGGSAYLAAALASPPQPVNAAGRLLTAMVKNDRAMTYQTTVRQAEREENNAWTGTDPMKLDRLFERDARRYDNGFRFY